MKKYLLTLSIVLMGTLSIYANNWKTSVNINEMTGKKTCYVFSESVKPTKNLGWLYGNLKAYIGVGSNGSNDLWAYIGFTTDIIPNWKNESYSSNFDYTEATIKIKFDNTITEYQITQELLDNDVIHIVDDANFIYRLSKAESILIEIPLYDEGDVYFRFNVAGFQAKRQECISQF